jgi:chromosome segregation ATPase
MSTQALHGAPVDVLTSAASSAAAPSPGSAGNATGGTTRADRDARLLKTTDIPAIAERVLELTLLEPTVERAVGDALACANDWEQRSVEAKEAVLRAEQELAATPASERGNLVALVEAVSEKRRLKRRLQGEMEDARRAHGDKLDMRRYEVDQLRDAVSAVDVKLGAVRADVRLLEREQHSYEARIETMQEQRVEYRERLREFVGDDDLLRVSFKRYDTDQSGALDAGEIFAATQEVLRVSDEQAADAFTLQDARDQVEAYDRDGNGSLNFREFKKMFRKLIKVASGGGGGGGGGGRK